MKIVEEGLLFTEVAGRRCGRQEWTNIFGLRCPWIQFYYLN